MSKATILCDGQSYYIEWYRDDDNDSGYGDNPAICRWYGTRVQCEERAKLPSPIQGWHTPKWEPSPHAGEWF